MEDVVIVFLCLFFFHKHGGHRRGIKEKLELDVLGEYSVVVLWRDVKSNVNNRRCFVLRCIIEIECEKKA